MTCTTRGSQCMQAARGSRGTISRPYELTEPRTVSVTVFTSVHGPVPGTSVSLYCRGEFFTCLTACSSNLTERMQGCHTRYYHNYYVHKNATLRTYYMKETDCIQTSEHIFVQKDVLKLFNSMMRYAWYGILFHYISMQPVIESNHIQDIGHKLLTDLQLFARTDRGAEPSSPNPIHSSRTRCIARLE